MLTSNNSIMALDVGEKRIGVAAANAVARIPSALTTLTHDDQIIATLTKLVKDHDVAIVVVGLPRNLSGESTAQTAAVQTFGDKLKTVLGPDVPFFWQDEALTSHKAESELKARKKSYKKDDIDALAATYILEDFLLEHLEVRA